MAIGCGKKVQGWAGETRCGNSQGGVVQLCRECEQTAKRSYPQGWSYYPGDTCRHGRLVGGVGADLMCGACEQGDDDV